MTDILQKLDAVEQTLNECAFTCDSDAVGYIPEIRAALEGMQKGFIGELVEIDFSNAENTEVTFSVPSTSGWTKGNYFIVPTPPKGGLDGHS